MEMYLLLVIAAILFSTQFIFNQKFQQGRGEDTDSTLLFQMHTSIVSVLIMILLNQFRIQITMFSLIVGIIYSVDIMLYTYYSMKAFSTANLSVYSIFAMLGGMVLPFAYGTIFCQEGITVPKIISCVFIAIALIMTHEKGRNSKNAMGTYLAVFVFNGLMGVISKIHQSNVEHCTDSRSFVAIAYGGVFIISLVWYLLKNRKLTVIKPKELVYTSCYAACSGIGELCALVALTQLPASVQYPIVTGGVILFSAIVSAVYEKQRSVRSMISALIALVATIIIIL